jgi:hypothetical protein
MNLDDRIQRAVDAVIQQARSFLEAEVRALADHAVASSTEEREAAVAEAAKGKAAEIEDAVRQAREAAHAEHEAALREQQAAAERQQELAVQEARSAAQAEAAAALAAVKAEADQALAAVKAEADQAVAAVKADSGQGLAAAKADFDQALGAAKAEFDQALGAAKADFDQVLAAAKAEHEQKLEEAQTAAASRLAAVESRLAAVESKLAAAENEIGAAESEIAAGETEIAGLRDALASARALAEQSAAEKVSEAVTEAQLVERRADLACATRLLEITRRLDHAASLTEILDGLADYAHAEVGRAALFLVQGARLHGWRILGFENVPEDGHGVELDVGAAEVIARAVHTGEPAATSVLAAHAEQPGAGDNLPLFLALTAGRAGLAMPVHVGHQVVAVLYTDEGGGEPKCTPSAWPEIVEVVARHAGRCLEALTVSKVASVRSGSGAEAVAAHRAGQVSAERALAEEEGARRYARLLVSEIKLYNEAAVAEGKQARNVLARLRPEIDRARRLYEEKYPVAFGARVNWFEEELVKTLADGDASLLGKVT